MEVERLPWEKSKKCVIMTTCSEEAKEGYKELVLGHPSGVLVKHCSWFGSGHDQGLEIKPCLRLCAPHNLFFPLLLFEGNLFLLFSKLGVIFCCCLQNYHNLYFSNKMTTSWSFSFWIFPSVYSYGCLNCTFLEILFSFEFCDSRVSSFSSYFWWLYITTL